QAMAKLFKLSAQFYVVVDLAVGNNGQATILVVKRLRTAGEINDAEAAHRQGHICGRELAFAVRSPVTQPVIHRAESSDLARLDGPITNDACNAAHQSFAFGLRAS